MWLIVVFLFTAVILLPVALAWKSFAPWVPTRKDDLPRITALARLKAGDTFFDLGCGNGRVVRYVCKNTQARAVGIEFALPFFLICRAMQLTCKKDNSKFYWKNLLKFPLTGAQVVYVFGTMETLKHSFAKKLLKELRPGAKVISYAFPILSLKPTLVDKPSKDHLPIYVYEF